MDVLTAKSREKRAARKLDPLKTARKVQVEDLKIGMRIVTRWHKNLDLSKYIPKGLSVSQGLAWMADAAQYDYVAKSLKIDQLEECPGKWRTHIHVNRADCHDMRAFVWVVNE
jgi:hypothetical protein